MTELKPCPICNTNNYVYVVPGNAESTKFICVCNVCGHNENNLAYDTMEEAEEAWNKEA